MGKLQVRRGTSGNRPNPLDSGELGWDTDTKQLWMGTGTANANVLIGGAAASADYTIYVYSGGDTVANGATGLELVSVAADNVGGTTDTTNIYAGSSDPFTSANSDGYAVYNATRDRWSVATYVGAGHITCSPAITGQVAGDQIIIANAIDNFSDAYGEVPSSFAVNITIRMENETFTYPTDSTFSGKSATGTAALTIAGSTIGTTNLESTTTGTITFGDALTLTDVTFPDHVTYSGVTTATDCPITGNLTTNATVTLTTSDVTGNVTANAAITLNNTDIGGTLTANDDFTNTTDITVTGDATIEGTATLATATFSSNLTTNGVCTNTTSLDISGNWTSVGVSTVVDVSVGGDLTISDTFNCTTDLDVTGDITTTAQATVAGTVTCDNITTSVGVFTQTGSLNVTTNATFNANAIVDTVTIGGNLVSNATLTQTTSMSVTGNMTTSGNTTVVALTVSGNLTTNADFTQTTSLAVTGTWDSFGTTIAAGVTQTGASDFSGPVTLTGTNTFNGEVSIRDSFTASGTTFNKRVFEYFGASIDWSGCSTSGDDGFIITKSTSIANVFRASSNVTFESDPGSYTNISSTVNTGYTIYVATAALGGSDANNDGLLITQGTATSTTANKLVDSTANFNSADHLNKTVYNSTDDTWAEITAIDSTTQVTLDTDIMASGESYEIAAAKATIENAMATVPGTINSDTTLLLSDETHAGDWIVQGKAFSGAFTLKIQGMEQIQFSGTATSATQGTGGTTTYGTVTDTGSGWTTDAYEGMILEWTSGAMSGERYTIYTNTSSVITIIGRFSSAPSTDNYKIINPASTISGLPEITAGQIGVEFNMVDITNTGWLFVRSGGELTMYYSKFVNVRIEGGICFTYNCWGRNVGNLSRTFWVQVGGYGYFNKCLFQNDHAAGQVVHCDNTGQGTNGNTTNVVDGMGTCARGVYIQSNATYADWLNTTTDCQVLIKDCTTGIQAETGGIGTYTNSDYLAFSGCTTDKNAVSASYGYLE